MTKENLPSHSETPNLGLHPPLPTAPDTPKY